MWNSSELKDPWDFSHRFLSHLSQMSLSFFIWVLWLSSARLVSRSVSWREQRHWFTQIHFTDMLKTEGANLTQSLSNIILIAIQPWGERLSVMPIIAWYLLAICLLGKMLLWVSLVNNTSIKSEETIFFVLKVRFVRFYRFNVFSLQIFLTIVLFLPQSQKLLMLLFSQLLQTVVLLTVRVRTPDKGKSKILKWNTFPSLSQ